MLILNEKEMWSAVTLEEVMDAIEEAFAIHKSGNFVMPERFIAGRDKNMMLYMPCFLDNVIGTKMLAEFPDNPQRGLPYLSGLMILNDAETGRPQAIMDGGALTAMRTGAAGGVAIRHLAPEGSRSAGLVGCGVQGFHQLLYACAARPVREIYLYDAYQKDYDSFIRRLEARLANRDIRIVSCRDARELAEKSEILISATQTAEPVYPDDTELLRGKTMIAVGSWRPERRELPDAVFKLVKNVYTELPYACQESGDLRIPLSSGLLTSDRIRYMEDLLEDERMGHPQEQADTRCFKSVGMGIYDAQTAQLVFTKALSKGIGQTVDW